MAAALNEHINYVAAIDSIAKHHFNADLRIREESEERLPPGPLLWRWGNDGVHQDIIESDLLADVDIGLVSRPDYVRAAADVRAEYADLRTEIRDWFVRIAPGTDPQMFEESAWEIRRAYASRLEAVHAMEDIARHAQSIFWGDSLPEIYARLYVERA